MNYPTTLHEEFEAALADDNVAVGYDAQFRFFAFYAAEPGMAIGRDQEFGESYQIQYDPWSGKPLPTILFNEWHQVAFIDYGCVEDNWKEIEKHLPAEMLSDVWWRDRIDHQPDWVEHLCGASPEERELFPADEPFDIYINDVAPGLTRFPDRPVHLCWASEVRYFGPRTMYAYLPWTREYGIRVIDPDHPVDFQPIRIVPVPYCPFCGCKLPPSLREEWIQQVQNMGLVAADSTPEERSALPSKFVSDAWWKEDNRFAWAEPAEDEPDGPRAEQEGEEDKFTPHEDGESWHFATSIFLGAASLDPDIAIDFEPMFRFYSIYRVEPGRSAREELRGRPGWWLIGEPFSVDPWSGQPLPQPTGTHWEEVARADYGIERFPIEDIMSLPGDLRSATWWQDRLATHPEWNGPQSLVDEGASLEHDVHSPVERIDENHLTRPPHACDSIVKHVNDPAVLFEYLPWVRECGVRIIDFDDPIDEQPLAIAPVVFCPWCGEQMKISLRKGWRYRLTQLGFTADDSTPDARADLPPEFASDKWWQPQRWGRY